MQARIACAWLFFGTLAVYLTTYNGYLNVDGEVMYRTTESLVERGTFAIIDSPFIHDASAGGIDGQRYAWQQPGQSILSIPLYVVARWVGPFLPGPAEMKKRFIVGLFAPLSAAAAVAFFFLLLVELGTSPRDAILLALLLAFATILWPYSKRYYREAFLTLCLVQSARCAVMEAKTGSLRRAWAAGLWFALLVLTKSVFALLLPFACLALLLESTAEGIRPRRALPRRLLALCLPCAAVVVFLLFMNRVLFGGLLEFGHLFTLDTPVWVGIHGYLFSPGRSVFLYSPVLCLAVWGLPALRRRDPLRFGLCATGLGAYFLFHCKLMFGVLDETFSGGGGGCWGPRYLVPIVPLLLLPLADWMREGGSRRLLRVVICFSIAVQLLGVLVYNRATVGPRKQMGVDLDQEDFVPEYCPVKEHLLALFEAKFDRVEGAPLAPGQEEGDAFRVKNDGITCWWMFLWRLGYPAWVLIAPALLICTAGLAFHRLRRSAYFG